MTPEPRPRSFDYRSFPDRHIDLLQAEVRSGSFDPHFHEDFLVGFTLGGVEQFMQANRLGRSLAGQVRVVEPGVVHTGAPGTDEPWRYAALYIAPEIVRTAERAVGLPMFDQPVIDSPPLFASGMAFIEALLGPDESEQDSRQTEFLLRLTEHRSASPFQPQPEPRKTTLARAYIRDNLPSTVRLDELAEVVGLSKFHLLRTFKEATGLTPWRYQVQLRLSLARDLLRKGTPASEVAVVCGFFDQSHFTRQFRASFGVTPAAFASAHRAPGASKVG